MSKSIYPYVTTTAAVVGIWVATHAGAAFSTPMAAPPTPVTLQLASHDVDHVDHQHHQETRPADDQHHHPKAPAPATPPATNPSATSPATPPTQQPATPPASNPVPQTCEIQVNGGTPINVGCSGGPSNMPPQLFLRPAPQPAPKAYCSSIPRMGC
jgi:hypothetical protein